MAAVTASLRGADRTALSEAPTELPSAPLRLHAQDSSFYRASWQCMVPDTVELRCLQSTRSDVSGTLKFFLANKVGVRPSSTSGDIKLGTFHSELDIHNGLLVHIDKKDPRIIGKLVPRAVRAIVMEYFHRSTPRRHHLGAAELLGRMCNSVWWPMMKRDVQKACSSCTWCMAATEESRLQTAAVKAANKIAHSAAIAAASSAAITEASTGTIQVTDAAVIKAASSAAIMAASTGTIKVTNAAAITAASSAAIIKS